MSQLKSDLLCVLKPVVCKQIQICIFRWKLITASNLILLCAFEICMVATWEDSYCSSIKQRWHDVFRNKACKETLKASLGLQRVAGYVYSCYNNFLVSSGLNSCFK